MIVHFLDNLAITIVGLMGIATVLFLAMVIFLGVCVFFIKLYEEGSPLKAWTVGITLAIVILTAVKTWYFGK